MGRLSQSQKLENGEKDEKSVGQLKDANKKGKGHNLLENHTNEEKEDPWARGVFGHTRRGEECGSCATGKKRKHGLRSQGPRTNVNSQNLPPVETTQAGQEEGEERLFTGEVSCFGTC